MTDRGGTEEEDVEGAAEEQVGQLEAHRPRPGGVPSLPQAEAAPSHVPELRPLPGPGGQRGGVGPKGAGRSRPEACRPADERLTAEPLERLRLLSYG